MRAILRTDTHLDLWKEITFLMAITANTLSEIKAMTVREFLLSVRGCYFWRDRLGPPGGGCPGA